MQMHLQADGILELVMVTIVRRSSNAVVVVSSLTRMDTLLKHMMYYYTYILINTNLDFIIFFNYYSVF